MLVLSNGFLIPDLQKKRTGGRGGQTILFVCLLLLISFFFFFSPQLFCLGKPIKKKEKKKMSLLCKKFHVKATSL